MPTAIGRATHPRQTSKAVAAAQMIGNRKIITLSKNGGEMKKIWRTVFNVLTAVVIGCSFIIICSVTSPIVTAQTITEEPTLQESLDFIRGKVNASGCNYNLKDIKDGHGVYWNYREPQSIVFEGKKGVYNQVLKSTVMAGMTDGSTRKKESVTRTKYEFNLDELSAANIKLINLKELIESPARPQIKYVGPCFPVEIHTYNDEMKISKESSNPKDREDQTNMMRFHFDDEDTAKRVVKAFAQAIKLSGGKKESF